MFRTLTTKGLYDKRWFILGWSVGVAIMIAAVIAFYPSFSQDSGFDEIIKNAPEQLKPFLGDINAFKTVPGYVGGQLFDYRMPIMLLIMVIILAIGLTAAEEEAGQLQQLIVQPISRAQIVIEKWLTMTIVVTVVHIIIALSLLASLLPISGWMDPLAVAQVTIMCWLLTMAFGTMTLAIGFATGRRSLTVGIGSLIAFGSFFLSSFALSVEWLKPFDVISPFHYYKASEVISSGFDSMHVLVLAGIIATALIIALLGFRRRDIIA